MADLAKASKAAVEKGAARRVSDTAIVFTGTIDKEKRDSVEASYGDAVRKRREDRLALERKAARELEGFRLTY